MLFVCDSANAQLRVKLCDSEGKPLGAAQFRGGKWETDDKRQAAALKVAAETAPQFGIRELTEREPKPPPGPSRTQQGLLTTQKLKPKASSKRNAAVAAVLRGEPQREVAEAHGVAESTLRGWVSKAKAGG